MTFTEVLKNPEAKASEKLSQLQEIVTNIRTSYGNKDITIDIPYVPTPDGLVSLAYIDEDSKVVLAGKEIRRITIDATEITEAYQGTVFDKVVESRVATNPILCNLSASTGSKYI